MKLISINIEGDRHLKRFIPFLKKEQPDVFAAQEIFKETIPEIEKSTGLTLAGFYPVGIIPVGEVQSISHAGLQDTTLGVAIFTRLPVSKIQGYYYVGNAQNIPVFKFTVTESEPNTINQVLICLDVVYDNTIYTILTTHFTFTPMGLSTKYQLEHLESLLTILENISSFVFLVDLNAPRGRETWTRLSNRYKDNIPLSYTSSLDPVLHKTAGTGLEYLVDGCFTTPEYEVQDIKLVEGVSDHKGIVAHVQKI